MRVYTRPPNIGRSPRCTVNAPAQDLTFEMDVELCAIITSVTDFDALQATLRSRFVAGSIDRVLGGLEIAAGRREVPLHPGQERRGFFVPGLEYAPWLDARRFRHTAAAEAAFNAIQKEAAALFDGSIRCTPHGHAIDAAAGAEVLPGNPTGWTEWLLYKDFRSLPERRAPFPAAGRLADHILATNEYVAYINFQILNPGTRIDPHVDRHNCLATWWLPIFVPEQRCGIDVGGQIKDLVPGRAVAFDNSYVHRTWNDADSPRIVLVAYVFHPELTQVERQAIGLLIQSIPDINAAFDAAPSPAPPRVASAAC